MIGSSTILALFIMLMCDTNELNAKIYVAEVIVILLYAIPWLIGIKEWLSGEDEILELEYKHRPGGVRKWVYRLYNINMLVFILWTSWYVFIDDVPRLIIFPGILIFFANIVGLINSLAITHMHVHVQYFMLVLVLLLIVLALLMFVKKELFDSCKKIRLKNWRR
ncbi:hypothetical protein HK407_09g15510 [Ordospora pajunii]|uniref:uncharacterized protein n=1 Tax=Ordospora pajunii TaxID=3039483 RepID=UPI00295284DA|nr:uncharacterized protein HK407_09g15510 [Ordospora pajunii]KAH9410865.1 hypothetical protein HK407_09g15510 [Ordospora pajunii]